MVISPCQDVTVLTLQLCPTIQPSHHSATVNTPHITISVRTQTSLNSQHCSRLLINHNQHLGQAGRVKTKSVVPTYMVDFRLLTFTFYLSLQWTFKLTNKVIFIRNYGNYEKLDVLKVYCFFSLFL